jgi:beta-1,2-mannobiose phosphorylase / 1,2-beta-oligomannan phosphorylase
MNKEIMLFTDSSEGASAKDPAVVELNGLYYLYYTVKKAKGTIGIGIATSQDLTSWDKIADLPFLSPCDKNGIAAPGAIVLNDCIHIFYQSYPDGFKKAKICHATSTDGIHFTANPSNPIFSPTGDWNCGRAIDADVIEHNNQLLLYFSTRDPDFKI